VEHVWVNTYARNATSLTMMYASIVLNYVQSMLSILNAIFRSLSFISSYSVKAFSYISGIAEPTISLRWMRHVAASSITPP
jgi:hypothetical protein